MNSVYEISLYKSFTATECVEYRGQWCDECGEDNGGCLFCYNCGVRKEIIKCGECFTIQKFNEWVNWIECECKQSNCCPSCYCTLNRCVRRECMCPCRFCLGEYNDESDDDESDDDESDDDESDDDYAFECAECSKKVIRDSEEHDNSGTIDDTEWFCSECFSTKNLEEEDMEC